MPAPAPFSTPQAQQAPYPALYLYPLNDSFVPKHIALSHGIHVKIGRQTNAKTAPGERNGYFDSKVLSRQHAEVWEENGKIFIKDVKSSNGTFINGERLSIEAVESDPYELKSDDIVEFGIDIVGEDNKTIIHHKVAARVVCVFSEQDAQVAARAEQHQQQQQQQYQQTAPTSSMAGQPGPSGINGAPSGFNFNNTQQRRPQLSQPGLAGMGGMGGSMRPPGKSGLTFDVILSRLQGELQKSRETGAELNSLTGAINEIHDTLGGGLPTNPPPFPSVLPPVRPAQEPAAVGASPEQPSTSPSTTSSTSVITELQTQLRDTQSSLASQLDKIRTLESVLSEQEAMKQEVRTLREMIETRRREMEHDNSEDAHQHNQHPESRDQGLHGGFDLEEDEEPEHHHDEDDDDDARSINTIVPHELERVDEEDEEQLVEEERQDQERLADQERPTDESDVEAQSLEERERRQSDLGRPRTPEPIRMGMRDSDAFDIRNRSNLLAAPRRTSGSSPLSQVASSGVNADDIHEQISRLSAQVSAAVALTSTLEAQHTAAQSTILALESKVETLENMLRATQQAQAQMHDSLPPPSPTSTSGVEAKQEPSHGRESVTEVISEWMKSVEGKWNTVQDEWNQERERLGKAREEWEAKVKQVDSGLEKIASFQTSAAAYQTQLRLFESHGFQQVGNGDAVKHNGLVTPPSPRSQSSDSGRYRRRRRRSSGSARGRSRSRSRSRSGSMEREDIELEDSVESSSGGAGESKLSNSFTPSRAYSPDSFTSEDKEPASGESALASAKVHGHSAARSLITPEPSVYKISSPSSVSTGPDLSPDQETSKAAMMTHAAQSNIHVQTAMGVLLLSVAAAAVIWKVKPE